MNRRLTPRGRERRAQLMEYAARRFAEDGYHPTSVSDIVNALGVGKGVFYWYFSSKEELFIEILRDAQFSLRKGQQSTIGAEPDPVMRIRLGMVASMRWFGEHRHLANLFQFAATEQTFRPTVDAGHENAVNDAIRHVKDGIAEGRFRDGDPLLMTHAIIGVTNELARRFLLTPRTKGQPMEVDAVARAAADFVLHGLTAAN